MVGDISLLRAFVVLTLVGAQSLFGTSAPQTLPSQSRIETTASLALATSTSVSLNWSGYVARGGTYTEVYGSWVVPRVAPSTGTYAADATWVGIGGVRNQNLIQAGTQAIVDPSGDITYEAWIERLPDVSVPVPLAVKPGDEVSVHVHEIASDEWRIDMRNLTTGDSFSIEVPYDSLYSSAEWVQERPTSVTLLPLSYFGSVHFTGAWAIENGKRVTPEEANAKPVSMVNDFGDLLAVPSVLDENGSAFRVSRIYSLGFF